MTAKRKNTVLTGPAPFSDIFRKPHPAFRKNPRDKAGGVTYMHDMTCVRARTYFWYFSDPLSAAERGCA
jgi:hypothetical protein